MWSRSAHAASAARRPGAAACPRRCGRPRRWTPGRSATLDTSAGLAGVDLILARNEQEEATAIALAIRETLESPGLVAALVTPDRVLARRVAIELGRWGLVVDDSAATPLDRHPHGVFARLLAEVAVSDADPVRLLSLLKHPLAAFGFARPRCREAARILEIALFRGHRVPGGIAGLPAALGEGPRGIVCQGRARSPPPASASATRTGRRPGV